MLVFAAFGARSAPRRTAGSPRGVAGRCGAGPRRIQPGVPCRKRVGPGVGRVALRHHRGRDGRFGRLDRHHVPRRPRLLQLETAAAHVARGAVVQGVRARPGVAARARRWSRHGSRLALLLWWAGRVFGRATGIVAALVLATTYGFLYVHSGRSGNSDALFTLLITADRRHAVGGARPPLAPRVAGRRRRARVHGEGHGHPDARHHHRRRRARRPLARGSG